MFLFENDFDAFRRTLIDLEDRPYFVEEEKKRIVFLASTEGYIEHCLVWILLSGHETLSLGTVIPNHFSFEMMMVICSP